MKSVDKAPVLPLVGDGDEVDLVEDIESAFGIRFSDVEAETCHTVGDLHGLILAKLPDREGRPEACQTARAFYRLRRAINDRFPDRRICPATRLDELVPRYATGRLLDELGRATGLRMPVGSLSVFAIIAAVALVGLGALFYRWTGAAVGLIGAYGILRLCAHWASAPKRIGTVGDLAKAVTGTNIATLKLPGEQLHDREVWSVMEEIIRDLLNYGGPITRSTRFFAKKS